MKKINTVLARALAEQAVAKLKELSSKRNKDKFKECSNSQEVIELRKLMKAADLVRGKQQSLQQKINKKFNHGNYVNVYPDSVSFRDFVNKNIDITSIKNEMIVANHTKGVDENSLIDYIIKKHS